MTDGWDLHAVVSGCTTTSTTANVTFNGQITNVENPLPDLVSLTFNNDDTPFYYPEFGHNSNFEFQGLDEIYRSYNFLKPHPNIPSTSSIPLTQQQTQLLPQLQQLITPQLKNSRLGSSLTLSSVRSRRKNQQTKLMRQMTHEELLADSWAWRKYGQKPIKGSPYPRNYYRCSTSKGCAARKQVEKSPSDPDIYVVSFSGQHTHPRPTHRNSLAGTTRNKFSRPTPGGNSSGPPSAEPAVPTPPCSSSSPVSASSFSPPNPLTEGESAPPENSQTETIEIVNCGDEMGETEFDEHILIPNKVMSEDIFRGLQELGRASDSTRF